MDTQKNASVTKLSGEKSVCHYHQTSMMILTSFNLFAMQKNKADAVNELLSIPFSLKLNLRSPQPRLDCFPPRPVNQGQWGGRGVIAFTSGK